MNNCASGEQKLLPNREDSIFPEGEANLLVLPNVKLGGGGERCSVVETI